MRRQNLAVIAVVILLLFGFLFREQVKEVFNLDPETKKAALNNGEVRVYNWSHYIADEVLKDFQEQTGISVIYDNYSSNEEMLARVTDGTSGYDIAFPSDYMVSIMGRKGLLLPIRKNTLRNYSNLDPTILQKALAFDQNNTFAVPYMWGTVGIGYDSERITRAPRSISDLRQDSLRGHISIIDDERFGLGAILKELGYSANTVAQRELDAAVDWLLGFKPFLLSINSEKYLRDLETGEALAAIGFSGDIAQVSQARLSIRYSIPRSGAVLWIDNMVVLREAKNPANAHEFIDFLLEASNGARIANVIRYASANLAARGAGMDVELLQDRSIFPESEILEKSEVLQDLGDQNRLYTESWLRFRQGQSRESVRDDGEADGRSVPVSGLDSE